MNMPHYMMPGSSEFKFTVLTRTASRPLFFEKCRNSVIEQTIKPLHIVSIDDDSFLNYAIGDVVLSLKRENLTRHHNVYFNTLKDYAQNWIIHLDDDDMFMCKNALEILDKYADNPTKLLLWQVKFGKRLIPPQTPGRIARGRISGIGFAVHKSQWINWEPIGCADYDVLHKYESKLEKIWIPHVLTGLQYKPGLGIRKDIGER